MRRKPEQSLIRHAIGLGCGVFPVYEGGEVVGWRVDDEVLGRARAMGRYIKEHPKQFDSKDEPSIIAVSGGWPGIALPNNPKPPVHKREGIVMRDCLWGEFGIEANIVDVGSEDTITNGSDVARIVLADERFASQVFSRGNAVGIATSRTHFWRAGPIFGAALLGEDADPGSIQLIKAPHVGGLPRMAIDGLSTLLLAGINRQVPLGHRNPTAMEGAAEAFAHLRRSGMGQVAGALLLGMGVPLPEQPFARVAREFMAQPVSLEAEAAFLASITGPTQFGADPRCE